MTIGTLTPDQIALRDRLFETNVGLAHRFVYKHRFRGERFGKGHEPRADDRIYQDVLHEALLALLKEAERAAVNGRVAVEMTAAEMGGEGGGEWFIWTGTYWEMAMEPPRALRPGKTDSTPRQIDVNNIERFWFLDTKGRRSSKAVSWAIRRAIKLALIRDSAPDSGRSRDALLERGIDYNAYEPIAADGVSWDKAFEAAIRPRSRKWGRGNQRGDANFPIKRHIAIRTEASVEPELEEDLSPLPIAHVSRILKKRNSVTRELVRSAEVKLRMLVEVDHGGIDESPDCHLASWPHGSTKEDFDYGIRAFWRGAGNPVWRPAWEDVILARIDGEEETSRAVVALMELAGHEPEERLAIAARAELTDEFVEAAKRSKEHPDSRPASLAEAKRLLRRIQQRLATAECIEASESEPESAFAAKKARLDSGRLPLHVEIYGTPDSGTG